jgi:membrane protein
VVVRNHRGTRTDTGPDVDRAGRRAEGQDRERVGGQAPQGPTAEQGPPTPTSLGKGSWLHALKRAGKEFRNDNLTDRAAALTYYGVLSLFPGLLVLISILRLTGRSTTQQVLNNVTATAPGPARTVLRTAVQNLQSGRQSTAGVIGVVSLLGAVWSASGYVAAFMRASNVIYDVPEGRPIWKKLPTRLGVTVVAGFLVAVTALAVVLTGGLARQVGKLLHLGSGAVLVWDIVKWPVLVILISLLFGLLYWASPNARPGGFRWVSPGGLLAVVVWLIASAGFTLYVANFGKYNKTYGSLATVIIFLVWLWLTNVAILAGAELDAELQRERAIRAGKPPQEEPYTQLRDTRGQKGGGSA